MLSQRIRTALLLAAVLIVTLFWLPKSVAILLFAVLALAGGWEWTALLNLKHLAARSLYLAVLAAAMVALWLTVQTLQQVWLLLLLTLVWWLLALAWIVFRPHWRSWWLTAAAGVVVLVSAWGCLAELHRQTFGAQWVVFLLVLVVAVDIGGYFIGGRFGRRKLAPQVSPGKSWEGVAGGMVLALAIAAIGATGFSVPQGPFIVLCLMTAAVSVVGDLTESLFKRHAGLKDSGQLLPGHGGVLDRIDSITAAAPLFLAGLVYLGVLPS